MTSLSGRPDCRQLLLHEARKRTDIKKVIVKVLHQPDFRHVAASSAEDSAT